MSRSVQGSPTPDDSYAQEKKYAQWGPSPSPPRVAARQDHMSEVDYSYALLAGRSLQGDDEIDAKNLRCKCCNGGCIMSRPKYFCFLGSLCALLTGVLLIIVIFAIVPALVRWQINRSDLSFRSLAIEGIPSNTSVHMLTQVEIGHVLAMSADLGSMQLTVSLIPPANTSGVASGLLAADDSGALELGSMQLPPLSLHGPSTFDLDETFLISNADNFAAFAHAMLFEDTLLWAVHGEAAVTPHAIGITLPTQRNVPFDKTVEVAGCGQLKDVRLLSFNMRNSSAEQLRVEATIGIVNPSLFALHPMGTLTFDLFYRGFYQARLTTSAPANETFMNAGLNVLNFTGVLQPDQAHLDATNELIGLYLTGAGVTVEARAAPVASSIPLYNRAMQGLRTTAFLPGLANGTLITEIILGAAHMTPSLTDQTLELDMSLQFSIDSPLGPDATMDLLDAKLDVACAFLQETSDAEGRSIVTPLHIGRITMASPATVHRTDKPFTFEATMTSTLHLSDPVSNFQEFVRAFIASSGEVGLQFQGTVDVSASYLYGPLSVRGVPVRNSLYMVGAGGLNDTSEQSLEIYGNRPSCPPEPDGSPCGVLMRLQASIFNPSLLTLNLGTSWFSLSWVGVPIGALQLMGLSITPGWNRNILAEGWLRPAQKDLQVVDEFMSGYLNGKNHSVSLQGITWDPSQSNGPPPNQVLSSHQIVLAAIVAPAMCRGIQVESLLGDVAIGEFQFDFGLGSNGGGGEVLQPDFENLDDGGFSLLTRAVVVGEIVLPPSLSIPLHVTSTSVNMSLLFDPSGGNEGSGGDLETLGSFATSAFPVSYEPGSNTSLRLAFEGAHFKVSQEEVPAFQTFASQILSESSVNITMQGLVAPSADTNMGPLSLSGVPVSRVVEIQGYNSFVDSEGQSLVRIIHLDILGATVGPGRSDGGPYLGGGQIALKCNVSLTNPSPVAITSLGLLEFDVWFESVRIVTVSLANFSFNVGVNYYSDECTGTVWSPRLASPTDEQGLAAMEVTQRFVSDYIDGFPNNFTMVGKILQQDGTFRPGTSVPLLQPAFENFASNISLQGQPQPFITGLIVYLTWDEVQRILAAGGGIVPARAQLYNPFATSLTITHLNLTVLAGNLSGPVGGWLVPGEGFEPIFVPGFGSLLSPSMAVYLMLDDEIIAMLFEIFFGPTHSAPVSATGTMEVWIGAGAPGQPDPRSVFNQTVWAKQENVPATMGNVTMMSAQEKTAFRNMQQSYAPLSAEQEQIISARSEEEGKEYVRKWLLEHMQSRAGSSTPTAANAALPQQVAPAAEKNVAAPAPHSSPAHAAVRRRRRRGNT